MAKTRRTYAGAAAATTTSSNIAASGTTSFTVTAATGWPYGSDPFFVVVEPGTASEEKILVTRTGSGDTTINIASDSVRAQDGTSAVAHATGSSVFPVFTALDADEANELASKWSAKGDLVSYGSSTFEKLAVGSNGALLMADSGATSGLKWTQPAYSYVQTVYFTSSGTFTKATYPWLRAIRAKVMGGGGGGGGGGVGALTAGSGGGAGGYAEKFITDIAGLSASETVTVGGGGSGGASGASGAAGTSSTFAGLTGGGGNEGIYATLSAAQHGGGGGTASGGDLNIPGGGGGAGDDGSSGSETAQSGMGGSGVLGFGGRGIGRDGGLSSTGENGGNYGGGGSGGAVGGSGTPSGGNGAGGIVILELFA